MSRPYSAEFFAERHAKTLYSAETILGLVRSWLPPVRSAVDVGCGVGTWLSVLQQFGVERILGVDGDWVAPEALVIPPSCFQERDLQTPLNLSEQFDLAICVEVAEHLPVARADTLIRDLTSLADFVLFSAAIPGQGGVNHVNEQWPEYWNDRFRSDGYRVLDLIRQRIWNDPAIPFWYRQNMLLFVRETRRHEIQLEVASAPTWPLAIVHPHLYLRTLRSQRPRS
ncbi:MAG: class I SAM-dependent methyltransferase [Planctomycetaceae bacterium]